MPALRFSHFSDVHLSAYPLGFRMRDRLGKRMSGWVNLRLLGRGHRFRDASRVLERLVNDLANEQPDHLIFSGDATMMGFDSEYAQAVELLRIGSPEMPRGIAVPGNHDVYVRKVVASQRFEHYFHAWQAGTRIDGEFYPFAQRVGDVWLIGVNSSRPTHWAWDASGSVGKDQRQRLIQLLQELDPGLRILVTHYPLCLQEGQPEPFWHRLRDYREMLQIARDGGVGLWLCGHRHVGYVHHPSEEIPFPVICVGSATQTHRWSYNIYTIEGTRLHTRRRTFSPKSNTYLDTLEWETELRLS